MDIVDLTEGPEEPPKEAPKRRNAFEMLGKSVGTVDRPNAKKRRAKPDVRGQMGLSASGAIVPRVAVPKSTPKTIPKMVKMKQALIGETIRRVPVPSEQTIVSAAATVALIDGAVSVTLDGFELEVEQYGERARVVYYAKRAYLVREGRVAMQREVERVVRPTGNVQQMEQPEVDKYQVRQTSGRYDIAGKMARMVAVLYGQKTSRGKPASTDKTIRNQVRTAIVVFLSCTAPMNEIAKYVPPSNPVTMLALYKYAMHSLDRKVWQVYRTMLERVKETLLHCAIFTASWVRGNTNIDRLIDEVINEEVSSAFVHFVSRQRVELNRQEYETVFPHRIRTDLIVSEEMMRVRLYDRTLVVGNFSYKDRAQALVLSREAYVYFEQYAKSKGETLTGDTLDEMFDEVWAIAERVGETNAILTQMEGWLANESHRELLVRGLIGSQMAMDYIRTRTQETVYAAIKVRIGQREQREQRTEREQREFTEQSARAYLDKTINEQNHKKAVLDVILRPEESWMDGLRYYARIGMEPGRYDEARRVFVYENEDEFHVFDVVQDWVRTAEQVRERVEQVQEMQEVNEENQDEWLDTIGEELARIVDVREPEQAQKEQQLLLARSAYRLHLRQRERGIEYAPRVMEQLSAEERLTIEAEMNMAQMDMVELIAQTLEQMQTQEARRVERVINLREIEHFNRNKHEERKTSEYPEQRSATYRGILQVYGQKLAAIGVKMPENVHPPTIRSLYERHKNDPDLLQRKLNALVRVEEVVDLPDMTAEQVGQYVEEQLGALEVGNAIANALAWAEVARNQEVQEEQEEQEEEVQEAFDFALMNPEEMGVAVQSPEELFDLLQGPRRLLENDLARESPEVFRLLESESEE